jgi:hypothetical protein
MHCGDTVAPLQRSRDKRTTRRGKKGENLQHYFWRLGMQSIIPCSKNGFKIRNTMTPFYLARLAICGQLNGGHGTEKGVGHATSL